MAKKMKKQTGSDKTDEKEGMEIHNLKKSMKKAKKGGKKTNPWIAHVKAYAKKHKMSYKDAISKAKASYKKK